MHACREAEGKHEELTAPAHACMQVDLEFDGKGGVPEKQLEAYKVRAPTSCMPLRAFLPPQPPTPSCTRREATQC